MSTRAHGSEDALGELTCSKDRRTSPASRTYWWPRNGFYSGRGTKRHLGTNAEVVVAELVPGVVRWNQGPLGEHAGHPLRDERVTLREGDVAKLLKTLNGKLMMPSCWMSIMALKV